jgi:transcriptional regulator
LYNPNWFRNDRLDLLQAEIRKINFATLVTTSGPHEILASHIPIMLDATRGERGTLFGHIARGNSQWRETKPGSEALVVFLGPDAYITPRWYQTKKQDGKVVPTWNYVAIHARGPITFFEDAAHLKQAVSKLTDHHESTTDDPWEVDDAPADYLETQLKAIIGFEVPIAKIEGKWKMSQNRPDADRTGVISGLSERDLTGDREVAEAMRAWSDNPENRS